MGLLASKRLYWVLILITILFLPALFYYKSIKTFDCKRTGSTKYVTETGLYFPIYGQLTLNKIENIEASRFHRDFHYRREPSVNRLIGWEIKSINPFYYWWADEECPTRIYLYDRSDIPYFVHLYNTETKFRDFVFKCVEKKKFELNWFIEEVCGVYACCGPYLNLFDPRVKLLFSYDSDLDWEPKKKPGLL